MKLFLLIFKYSSADIISPFVFGEKYPIVFQMPIANSAAQYHSIIYFLNKHLRTRN